MVRWIVSDVDGTLFSRPDRSPWSSDWAGRVVRKHRVVLASSRTVAETEAARDLLGWSGSMIPEDGAVLVHQDGAVRIMGIPVGQLWERIDGVGESAELIRRGADLAPAGAQDRLASILIPAAMAEEHAGPLASVGLKTVRGGRWATITSGTDKGATAAHLLAAHGVRRWAAIGNGPNDAPLLRRSTYPFVIRNPDGHEPELKAIPGAILLAGIGPTGWDEMLDLLTGLEADDDRSEMDHDGTDDTGQGGPSAPPAGIS